MKIRNRVFILIMIIAIASAQWVPAFAASKDNSGTAAAASAKARQDVEAEAAIVIDADTGEILYGKDAYSRREPASTTKIVTCLLALEHLEMDQKVTVKSDAVEMGNIIGVQEGEVFTAEQLIYAMMVYSANDAAVALAEEIGGTEDNFCEMMNQKAKACGAKKSNFQNPNGLNWAWDDQHYTTAYDLAVITQKAMEDETFREIVSTVEYDIPKTNKSKAKHLTTTNKFLWTEEIYNEVLKEAQEKDKDATVYMPEYSGVLGIKTGLTSTAGACMVSAIDYNGRELIAVVLHSEDDERYKDLISMWEYCKEAYYDTYPQMKAGEEVTKIRVKRGEARKVAAVAEEAVAATIDKGESSAKIKTEVEKYDLKAPVEKGDVVGVVKVYNGKELINERNLIAAETVEQGGFLSIFGIPDWMAPFVHIAFVLVVLILFVMYWLKKMKRDQARRRREERRKKNV